ncbi:hypothetical protein LCGC14_1537750 [marine sediment metagenome]|uniref:Uncharacterized protein n=1 Tax=marine sediment metagenome TaxID=412755 RepID=A0A0F9IU48_9ZZZZ
MANIQKPKESWYITNISSGTLTIPTIPSLPKLKSGQRIDLLEYTDINAVSNSIIIRNYVNSGLLKLEEYIHTHEDKADVDHTHENKADINHIHEIEEDIHTHEDKADVDHTHSNKADVDHTHSNKADVDHTHSNKADINHTHDNMVISNRETGGTDSAGEGKQYIKLNIGGTIYKILHDGTL